MTVDIECSNEDSNETISRKKRGDVIDLVGGDGLWQRWFFLVISYTFIMCATQNLAMSFLAPNLDHWCAKPPEAENISVEQWKSIGLPVEDNQCSRYDDVNLTHPMQDGIVKGSNGHEIVPCDAWEYDKTFYSSTVLSQWDLVCDRQWLVSMSKSVFVIGFLVAVIVSGPLSDKFGRRPVIAATATIGVLSAVICAFSTSFVMFIVSRFFVAVGMEGCYITGFVFLMEVVGPEFRSVYGIAINFGWCLGFVLLPAIAWLLRDWFWIQVAVTVPCVIQLAIWWMLPESPRWLLTQGKIGEAQKVLYRAARVNGRKLSDIDTNLKKIMEKANEVQQAGEANGSYIDLLRTPGFWKLILNVYFAWFVIAFVYYGQSYNTNELAGNPFINFALSGAVEFPAYLFSMFAIRSLGRRNPLAAVMVICGLACLISCSLPQDPWWIIVAVTNISKFCITCCLGIIPLFTAELFPTVVRSTALCFASLCGRIGSISAPFVRELGIATHPAVPQISFGILTVLSGALVLLLPDTNNCSVPDTLKEAVEAARRCKKPKMSNGNHVIITLSSGEADVTQEDMTAQAVFSPSPMSEKNGKKLADIAAEDSH